MNGKTVSFYYFLINTQTLHKEIDLEGMSSLRKYKVL